MKLDFMNNTLFEDKDINAKNELYQYIHMIFI